MADVILKGEFFKNARGLKFADGGGMTWAFNAVTNTLTGTTLVGYTVATLPSGIVGRTAYVTDALAPTFGATVTGGGATTIPVFYNGTAWIIA